MPTQYLLLRSAAGRRYRAGRLWLLLLCFTATAGPGQKGWQDGFNTPGLNGPVQAVVLRGNGDIIAGGDFTDAGGHATADHVARWNGRSWQALGEGPGFTGRKSHLFDLVALPNGDLVAAGYVPDSSSQLVMRWDGHHWRRLGPTTQILGFNSLAVAPNGDLLVGCSYSKPNSIGYASGVIRWDGTRWRPLGPEPDPKSSAATAGGSEVEHLVVTPAGEIVAAGKLRTADGQRFGGVGRWDGRGWQQLGTGLSERGPASCLVVAANGDLVAGGGLPDAQNILSVGYVARWDGHAWHSLGPTFDGTVQRLVATPSGDILASGGFDKVGGKEVHHLARWHGTDWQPLTTLTKRSEFANYSRAVLAVTANGHALVSDKRHGLLSWDGSQWRILADLRQAGFPGGKWHGPSELAVAANGDVLLGGYFPDLEDNGYGYLAHWNGKRQQRLGAGFSSTITAVAVARNGDFLTCAYFNKTTAGDTLPYLARWHGRRWQRVGPCLPAVPNALVVAPNGDVLAGGSFGVARWNSRSWQFYPRDTAAHYINSLILAPNGVIIVGGAGRLSGPSTHGYMARWDGQRWQHIGPILPFEVNTLALSATGSIIAGGGIYPESDSPRESSGHMARWNGTDWQPLGPVLNGDVKTIAVAANGDIIAGGDFTDAGDNPLADYIARWDGTRWQALGAGLNGNVYAVAVAPNSDIVVGGGFTAVGDESKAMFHFGIFRDQ